MNTLDSVKWLEGIALLFAAFIVIMPMNWRTCIKLALIMVVVEGAVRKWFLPGLSQFVYFGKDGLILAGYFKYLMSSKERERKPFNDPLLSFFALACAVFISLQATNDALGSPIIGIMGARNYLLYLPLLFLSHNLFKNQEELAGFLKFYLPLSIPVCLLALLQHLSPPDSAINVYVAAEETSKAMVGKSVRSTGTFSYIAGYAAYLQTVAALTIPLLVIHHEKMWTQILRFTLASAIAGIVLSGSRGPVVFMACFLIGYFITNRVFRSLGLYRKFVIPILLFTFVVGFYFSEALFTFGQRFTSNQDIGMRIFAAIWTPVDYMMHSGFFGFGSGSTYQANDRIRALFDLAPGAKIPVFYESEPERVMLEIGPIGFFLWYGLRIRIIILLWNIYKRLKLPLLRELALTAFLMHVLSLPGQVVFQITFNVYFWFLSGFVFMLPRIEKTELEQIDLEDNDSYTKLRVQQQSERALN